MKYLGIDVHSRTSVWSLVDEQGKQVGRGKVATTAPALVEEASNVACGDEVLAGQEIGTMAYIVHDAVTSAGVQLLSFNSQQLRMLLSSRTKPDRRDSYWIARAGRCRQGFLVHDLVGLGLPTPARTHDRGVGAVLSPGLEAEWRDVQKVFTVPPFVKLLEFLDSAFPGTVQKVVFGRS